MKVALLSTNDITGGAAMVTLRLTEALRQAGVDATMVAANIAGDGKGALVAPAGHRWRHKAAFAAERLEILAANGLSRKNLFKADTASFGIDLWRHPAVRQADVVALNWVNQGMLSLGGIGRIAREKPVVWTMHDMWPMTGICHHAATCNHYMRQCGRCPLLGWQKHAGDLSHRVWRRKERLYAGASIHFVAISRWLEEKARQSTLLRHADISLIPNAFPIEPAPLQRNTGRHELQLPQGKIILMAAARLDDPVKGLPLAVDALNRLADMHPNRPVTAIFAGAMRDPNALSQLRLPHICLGPVHDQAQMAALYANADVVLSSSHYETLPTTLIEGQAAGAVPVAFDQGGQPDIITHGTTGFLAPYADTGALARHIAHALDCGITPQTLRQSVADKFSGSAVAAKYIALFHKLLDRQSHRII